MDEEFEAFWKAYPRKLAKGDARKAWRQTQNIRPPLADVLQAIVKACRSEQWMKDCGAYVPYPATWLRGERWDDDYSVTLSPRLPDMTGCAVPVKQRTPEEIAAGKAAIQQALSLVKRAA